MQSTIVRLAGLALVLGGAMAAMPAQAAPEEIQVYMDEIDAKGAVGLDVHLNDVFTGEGGADYPGGEASLHRVRVTPEFSLGLGGGFEGGVYLPLATIAGDGKFRVEGFKLRMKWINPQHKATGFYYGANFEIGRVNYRLDQNPWNAEFKTILGWRGGRWSLAANGNFDFPVSGPVKLPLTIQIATRATYAVTPDLALGVESYNDVGTFTRLGHLGENEQIGFAVATTHIGGFDFDFGIGRGYAGSADHLVGRVIVGVPL
jgi:hypothetical protein